MRFFPWCSFELTRQRHKDVNVSVCWSVQLAGAVSTRVATDVLAQRVEVCVVLAVPAFEVVRILLDRCGRLDGRAGEQHFIAAGDQPGIRAVGGDVELLADHGHADAGAFDHADRGDSGTFEALVRELRLRLVGDGADLERLVAHVGEVGIVGEGEAHALEYQLRDDVLAPLLLVLRDAQHAEARSEVVLPVRPIAAQTLDR